MSGEQSLRRQELRSEIRKELGALGLLAKLGFLSGSFGNMAGINNETIGNPGAAPSSYIYQAIVLTAQSSGVFAVGWDVPWNSGTTADSVTLAVKSVGWPNAAAWAAVSATGKQVLTNASKVASAPGGGSVGGAINGGTAPGVYQATTAGTTITNTVTGSGSQTTTLTTAAFPTLTGLLTAQGMQWNAGDGLVSPGPAGFPLGSPVVIEWLVSATNTISMTGGGSFYAYELPPLA